MAAEAPKADEEGTYAERVLRVAEMMDPRTALCSDAEVDAAVALVRDHEAGLRVAARACSAPPAAAPRSDAWRS